MSRLKAICLFLSLAALGLSACASRPLALAATPTPPVAQYCQLRVDGRWIKDAAGNTVVLHGATLPTLEEMEASDRPPEQRLEQLAEAGARVVRLPVDDLELTPTFVPAKLSPFIDRANALGMLVILAFRNNPEATVNAQADESEDFLRLMMTYLRNAPGVWFEPLAAPVDSPKWPGIAQRTVDIARGYLASNAIVLGNPVWLRDGSGPLSGANVVYVVTDPNEWPLDAAPFMVLDYAGQDLAAIEAAQVGTLARDDSLAPELSPLWKTSLVGCR